MSGDGWDVISSVIGGVLGTAVGGPVGGVLGAAGGALGAEALHDSPAQAPAKPPPYPGTAPGVPPYPTLPPPPGLNAPGSGGAVDAAGVDAKALAEIVEHLEQLDKSAAATVEAIHAAGAAGQKALEGIQKDVDAKITELGPRLNTPEGQKELREFLKDKLSSAKKIIDDQIADAETKARQTRDMTQRYLDAAGGQHGKTGGDGDGSGGGGSAGGGSGGGDQGTTPAAAPASPASPYGQGMPPGMPGAGMMPAGMPMPSIPSFGGGGMPGLGGGDPLGALSGLGGLGNHGQDPSLQDGAGHGDSGTPKLHDGDGASGAGDKASDQPEAGSKPAGDHGSLGAGTEPAANHVTNAGDAGGVGPDGGTHVALPDGTTVEARSTMGANAARAALGGAPVADAWHQAGVTVPPPGTPVTSPIPPTLLKAGDVGVWKDHLVMALGNNKVLVSGQVQPLTSVGSGPDFLGWMDPSAAPGAPVHPKEGEPPAGSPPGSQPS